MLKRLMTFLCVGGIVISLINCGDDDTTPCAAAPQAEAGADQIVEGTTVVLGANDPEGSSGTWSIITGTGGTFDDATDPGATFTGTVDETYTLAWTLAGCPESVDEVIVQFVAECVPVQANAGTNIQTIENEVTLAANDPGNGVGVWTIEQGAGGVIDNVNNPTASLSGVVGESYILKWTVTACGEISEDVVHVNFIDPNTTDPTILRISESTIVNGQVVTFTGINFSDNLTNHEIFLTHPVGEVSVVVLHEITPTSIIGIVIGDNGGSSQEYSVMYRKVENGNTTNYPSNLTISIEDENTTTSFLTGMRSDDHNTPSGQIISLGIRNGSLNPADYSVKFVRNWYWDTVLQQYLPYEEYSAEIVEIVANGYNVNNVQMDALRIVVPQAPNEFYKVIVTYQGKSYCANWNFLQIISNPI